MSENLSVSNEVEKYKYIRKISLKTFVFKRFKFNLEALLLPSQKLQPLSLGLPSVGTKRNQITTHEVRPKTGETNHCLSDVMKEICLADMNKNLSYV